MPRFYSSAAGDNSGAGSSSASDSGQQPAPKPVSDDPQAKPVPQQAPGNDEPDMVLEEDVASDGRDEKGEAMIRDLPQNPQLSNSSGGSGGAGAKAAPSSQGNSSSGKA